MSIQKLLTNNDLFLEPKERCKRCKYFDDVHTLLGVAFCYHSYHTCSKRYRLNPWYESSRICEDYEFKGNVQLSIF